MGYAGGAWLHIRHKFLQTLEITVKSFMFWRIGNNVLLRIYDNDHFSLNSLGLIDCIESRRIRYDVCRNIKKWMFKCLVNTKYRWNNRKGDSTFSYHRIVNTYCWKQCFKLLNFVRKRIFEIKNSFYWKIFPFKKSLILN